jgi:hypothetical protein
MKPFMGSLRLICALCAFAGAVSFAQGPNAAYCPDTSASANAIVCAAYVAFAAYTPGQTLDVLMANTATGATTIKVGTLGTKAVTYNGANAVPAGMLRAGATYRLIYDGTEFVLQGSIPAGGTANPSFTTVNVGSGFVQLTGTGVSTYKYSTIATCASAASPAVCANATAGFVSISAASTSIVVNTSLVTATSQIFVTQDASASVGTALGVTCYSALNTAPWVSARTAGTSFTITATAPSVLPACYSFLVIN